MKKVYSVIGVRLGTFIGGPAAGGYLLSQNFKAIGRADLARRALILGITITVAFTSIILALPDEISDKIPNILFPLVFMFLSSRLFDRYQKEAVNQLLETEQGTQVSNWNAFGISVLFAIALFIVVFLFYVLTDPTLF